MKLSLLIVTAVLVMFDILGIDDTVYIVDIIKPIYNFKAHT